MSETKPATAKHGTAALAAPGATQRLAAFAAGLDFEDIPKDVVDKAKLCILDHLGCAIFGSSLPSVQRLMQQVALEEAAPKAAIFGTPLRTSASLAALVNGSSAHAFQLDEIHIESTLHPASLAFPAAFALAQSGEGSSGGALLAALVAGCEVGIRVGLAAKGGMFKSGFHNQGTTGVFVAAAAAALMLGLDEVQTRHALGIAGSQAAGLMAVQDGAMTKSFHSGRAAHSGVYAATLARLGYTGIPDVLDGAYGTFFGAFVDDWAPEALTAGLGSEWTILRTGFKPAPASNGSITAMTAIDTIMRSHGVAAADIEAVTAYVSDNTLHHCGWPYQGERIQSVLSAQMNLRYGIAVMALDRQADVEQFGEDRIREPAILKFIERIDVAHEPRFEGNNGRYRVACRLVVRCKNGAEYEAIVPYRKGSPEDPMTHEQLVDKFRRLTKCLSRKTSDHIIRTVAELDAAADLRELADLLTTAK